MKKFARRILIPVLLVLILCMGIAGYLGNYYHASEDALNVQAEKGIRTENVKDRLCWIPEDPKAGLIFYPGGKVEYSAYSPLMEALAEQGILCVLPHLTGNLAFLELNAADGIMEEYPMVEQWYIGGHSLGGVAASIYAAGHADSLEGLILCAAYSTKDLTTSGLRVLSIYGSCDGVLSMSSYEDNSVNLPSDREEVVIEGGNHAYFGNYGEQSGDGMAAITREVQQKLVCEAITEYMVRK